MPLRAPPWRATTRRPPWRGITTVVPIVNASPSRIEKAPSNGAREHRQHCAHPSREMEIRDPASEESTAIPVSTDVRTTVARERDDARRVRDLVRSADREPEEQDVPRHVAGEDTS